jgi:hypothetical protein
MVNWQAELIDSPELSPDGPASDRSAGLPAAALREPTLVPQGGCVDQVTVAEPEHLRAEGQARLYSAEIPDQRSVSAARVCRVTLALGRLHGLPRNIAWTACRPPA